MPGFSARRRPSTRRTPAARPGRSLAPERAGLPVPPWFVVVRRRPSSTSLTPGSADCAGNRDRSAASSRASLEGVALAPPIAAAIDDAVRRLRADGELVAVRSSASDEDGAEHSFAGQLDSFLNVAPADVARRRCATSGGRASAIASSRTGASTACRRCRIRRPCWCSAWSRPRAAGVAFGADPVSGRRGVAVVSAVPGFGSAVVSGEADADTWLVDRAGTHRRAPHRREASHARRRPGESPGGVRTADVPRRARRSAGADRRRRFSRWRRWREPRDGTSAGRRTSSGRSPIGLVLLQSRPITSLRALADPDARAHHLGQQQHRRKLQRRHDAADVFVRARDLRGRLPAVLPDDGRARARDRRAGRDVPEHARPDSRPAVLQPARTGIACSRCCRAIR